MGSSFAHSLHPSELICLYLVRPHYLLGDEPPYGESLDAPETLGELPGHMSVHLDRAYDSEPPASFWPTVASWSA